MAVATLVLLLLLSQHDERIELPLVGTLEHSEIREASGIVASRKHPGVFWVHNDSGNAARLYAVRRDGRLIRAYQVRMANLDWEDIATDDNGRLYLGDIGNNGMRLPIRAVHTLDEPDPTAPLPADFRSLPQLEVKASTYYRFPNQSERFDAESLFVRGREAFVIAKYPDQREAEVYRIPLDPPRPLLNPATPVKVATLKGFLEPATGADLTPDGKRLAVVSYRRIAIFERDATSNWEPVASLSFKGKDDVEAIAWDQDDLILAGENRGVYVVPARTWQSRRRGRAHHEVRDHGR